HRCFVSIIAWARPAALAAQLVHAQIVRDPKDPCSDLPTTRLERAAAPPDAPEGLLNHILGKIGFAQYAQRHAIYDARIALVQCIERAAVAIGDSRQERLVVERSHAICRWGRCHRVAPMRCSHITRYAIVSGMDAAVGGITVL